MKITLTGYGTRGDLQPVMVLADALQRRGHGVRVLASLGAQELLRRAGLEPYPMPLDVQAVFGEPAARAMLARGDIFGFFKWLDGIERAHAPQTRAAVIEACADADCIVADALLLERCCAVAAPRAVPVLPLSCYPLLPTRAYPTPFITTRQLGGALNALTHRLLIGMLWKNSRADIATLRSQLGAPPARRSRIDLIMRERLPYLLGYSRHLAPPPPDWHPGARLIGAIRYPTELRARLGEDARPSELARWLDAGPAPVYLGFGSMPVSDPAPLIALTRRVLQRLGLRGVLSAGWSRLEVHNDALLHIAGNLDHDWLLPRCGLAVHHGGSGTVHATLGAGLPTVICPVFADQPFWGWRLEQLGVGATLPFRKLDEARLEAALRRCLTPGTVERARSLGRQLQAEDGLAAAIDAVESAASGAAIGTSARVAVPGIASPA